MSLWRRVFAERRSVVLPILGLLVGNIAVIVLGVLPLKRAVVVAEQDAVASSKKLVDAQAALKQAHDQKTSKDRADVELKKFYAEILPPNLNDPKVGAVNLASFWPVRIALESGVTFKSATAFTQERVKDSNLIRYSGQVTLSADYQNFRKFLYIAETSQEFLIIEKISISQPALAQNTGVLEITLDVSTYFHGGAP